MTARSIDPARLRAHVLERLEREPESFGYRGARGPAPIGDELADLVRQARPRGLAALVRRVTREDVVEALLEDRAVAALVAGLPLDEPTARATIARAMAVAASRGHDEVGVPHVLYVATLSSALAGALALEGRDVTATRRAVAGALDAWPCRGPAMRGRPPAANLHPALRRALVPVTKLSSVPTATALVGAVLVQPEADTLCGLEAYRLAFALLHGVAWEPQRPPPGTHAAVVLHDDPVTPTDFLMRLSRDWFDDQGLLVGLTERGWTPVAVFEASDAGARVNGALAAARKHRMPVRLTLEVPGAHDLHP